MSMRFHCSAFLMFLTAVSAMAGESLPSDEMQTVSDTELQFLINECSACHGEHGISRNAEIPSLAGKRAEDILQAAEQFYFFERHCPDAEYQNGAPKTGTRNMCDVAERLTKQEVMAVGAYFEAQKPPAAD